MEFPIKLYTIKAAWITIYIERSHNNLKVHSSQQTMQSLNKCPISSGSSLFVKALCYTLSFRNYDVFLSQRIVLTLANSADPEKMPHHAAFYLGLHWLSKYQFRGFEYTKGPG